MWWRWRRQHSPGNYCCRATKLRHFKWKKSDFQPPDVPFFGMEDPPPQDTPYSAYHYFKKYVTDDMMQLVVDETNLHSVQKSGSSLGVTCDELQVVLDMYFRMGLVQMPSVRSYGENDRQGKQKKARVINRRCSDVRKDGVGHSPMCNKVRNRCKNCPDGKSCVSCGKCNVYLCINKDRNCFNEFHE